MNKKVKPDIRNEKDWCKFQYLNEADYMEWVLQMGGTPEER